MLPPSSEASAASCILRCCPVSSTHSADDDEVSDSKSTTASMANRRIFEAKSVSSFFPGIYFTAHDWIPPLRESFAQFIEAYPEYADTRRADTIRAEEYYHLSISNHVCLDYIGIGLYSYAESQNVFHFSSAPPSLSHEEEHSEFPFFNLHYREVNFKSHLIQEVRVSEVENWMKRRIMSFLNLSGNDYSIVFTANRTSAFRMVADSYPFKSCRKLLTVYDHENEAVDAMIDSSETKRPRVLSAEFTWPRLRIRSDKLKAMIIRKKKKKNRGLFVFPLHSRVSGTRYSYQWTKLAEENGWNVLLDVCALGPKDMDSFGLSLLRPDFIVCSFYKIFAHNPTGFGCLLVKKSTIPLLDSPANAGILNPVPTKTNESSQNDSEPSPRPASPSQKSAGSVECRGLLHVDSLGLVQISNRARYLVNWLVNAMDKFQHSSSEKMAPLVRIYGSKTKFNRGPALAFNLLDRNGNKIEPVLVQKLAYRSNISLGCGLLNHISFLEEEEEGRRNWEKTIAWRGILKSRRASGSEMGVAVLSAAIGFLANFEDVYRLWAFIAHFLDHDMVERERQRYSVTNHTIIEI